MKKIQELSEELFKEREKVIKLKLLHEQLLLESNEKEKVWEKEKSQLEYKNFELAKKVEDLSERLQNTRKEPKKIEIEKLEVYKILKEENEDLKRIIKEFSSKK